MSRESGLTTTPWHVVYFRRHRQDDPNRAVPGRDYLRSLPASLRAELVAVLKAVADTPPPAFSGGGKWEAMKGPMNGFYQAKANGFVPGGGRVHARLFCQLDRNGSSGLPGPSLIIISGMTKPYLSAFRDSDYRNVKDLGDEFLRRTPRSIDS